MALLNQIKRLVFEIVSILHNLWTRLARPGPLLLPKPEESEPQDAVTRHRKKRMEDIRLSGFNRAGHAAHAKRCMSGV